MKYGWRFCEIIRYTSEEWYYSSHLISAKNTNTCNKFVHSHSWRFFLFLWPQKETMKIKHLRSAVQVKALKKKKKKKQRPETEERSKEVVHFLFYQARNPSRLPNKGWWYSHFKQCNVLFDTTFHNFYQNWHWVS